MWSKTVGVKFRLFCFLFLFVFPGTAGAQLSNQVQTAPLQHGLEVDLDMTSNSVEFEWSAAKVVFNGRSALLLFRDDNDKYFTYFSGSQFSAGSFLGNRVYDNIGNVGDDDPVDEKLVIMSFEMINECNIRLTLWHIEVTTDPNTGTNVYRIAGRSFADFRITKMNGELIKGC